jgi:hypothetical protein
MKWITLEIDLSKLGGNWHPSATHMDMTKNLNRVRTLIANFSERQLTRHGGTTIQSLVILVRRFYGYRPLEGQPATSPLSERSINMTTTPEDEGSSSAIPYHILPLPPLTPNSPNSLLPRQPLDRPRPDKNLVSHHRLDLHSRNVKTLRLPANPRPLGWRPPCHAPRSWQVLPLPHPVLRIPVHARRPELGGGLWSAAGVAGR